MQFLTFQPKDYSLLIDWIDSAECNLLWGGPKYQYPLTLEQISSFLSNDDVRPMVLTRDDTMVGYIELFRVSDDEYRLCRVLVVDKNSRGKGYGKQLVQRSVDYIREHFAAKSVSLAVFEHNQSAVGCYQSLGFISEKTEQYQPEFMDKPWPLLHMRLSLS
ncbi:GNAT family N-acetyltransferase [Aliivibrio kagoshimensis]|uniref:GNAT family N-acetyltransferase n=1 Tax=Aliivibrio kagoshimensis TaxID=2910230 RepID=UPI003D0FF31B